jgi:circadian clock protein KaiC
MPGKVRAAAAGVEIDKAPTGIQGLDEITHGGLPRGRPTLVCGGAGCGKTMLAIEFLVRGALEFGEPGVMMSFEETPRDLGQNVSSMGFDLAKLVRDKKLVMSYVRVERSEIEETGEYDLEGLFVRLGHAIDSIGARRVVLDTVESLFSGLANTAILRSELRRLFAWLKERGVTAIITGERGDHTLTRQGLEEYVSDCVIVLDHRVTEQSSTRRLRILKYRGSLHGTNEFPFQIGERGIEVLPITSLGLDHTVSSERVPSGIPALDEMLSGGFFRGSSILLSGTAGTGKTTAAASFVDAACRRGEKSIYFSFEESASQTIRNMRSVGLDLGRWVEKGLLVLHASRPTLYGLETHLSEMFKLLRDLAPRNVAVDPITSFMNVSGEVDVRALLMRLIDHLKATGTTAFLTALNVGGGFQEASEVGISSLIDTWLLVRDIELSGERNRGLFILKSRGMAHSNQIREFVLTSHGIELREAYLGPAGVLTGSARVVQEARDMAEAVARQQRLERERRALVREREIMEARIAALRSGYEKKADELEREIAAAAAIEETLAGDRRKLASSRHAGAGRQVDGLRDAARGRRKPR